MEVWQWLPATLPLFFKTLSPELAGPKSGIPDPAEPILNGQVQLLPEEHASIWYFISWERDKNVSSVTGRNTFENLIWENT